MNSGINNIEQLLSIETGVRDSRLEIRVTDNGVGISSEDLQKISDPFYTKKSFGVGLGLTVVKQITEQHNGGVEITSEEGKGTQVLLWLPILDQKKEV